MKRHMLMSLAVVAALCAGGFAAAESAPGTNSAATTQPAVDLKNTKCVVTGDDVGDSKLTATYEGKTYHFCCESCPADFKKDPAKYAKAVADNPSKYGIPSAK